MKRVQLLSPGGSALVRVSLLSFLLCEVTRPHGAALGEGHRKEWVGPTSLPATEERGTRACSLKATPAHVLRVLLKSQQ